MDLLRELRELRFGYFLEDLSHLLSELRQTPELLEDPDLQNFKAFIREWSVLHASQPDRPSRPPSFTRVAYTAPPRPSSPPPPPTHYESSTNIDELLDEDCVPPDNDPPAEMGPIDMLSSDSDNLALVSRLEEIKIAASEAASREDYEGAIKSYTECIKAAPTSLVFARRAECFLKLKKPNAAIRDCDAATNLNADCGKAFKIRGTAHRLLGHWEEALKDLGAGQALDYDPDTYELQRVVQTKCAAIRRRRQQRFKEEEQLRQQEAARRRNSEREARRREEEAERRQRAEAEAEAEARRRRAEEERRRAQTPPPSAPPKPRPPVSIPPHIVKKISEDPDLTKVFCKPTTLTILAEICAHTFGNPTPPS
uniref:Hsp70-interacting protein N-terminal domain-containing protein n=1 Tax=Pyramimonas obovata TaxID=1411642 RepID=A0A7S0R6J8_9CHLO|mmetsp:Transcript_26681/g.58080  ORF Transcript_26681/g.58080 Transcript_26681/m.58080 type:complete len:368 (+) Transcript_26681:304-1407(+)